MAEHHPRPGGSDVNPDLIQVPADTHSRYPCRLAYPPTHQVTDLLDAQRLDRHDLRAGGHPGLLGPGQLNVLREHPVRHVTPARFIGRPVGPRRLVGELQVHVRVQEHPQGHRRLTRILSGDDHPAGGGVILPGLGHPGPDLLLERAVVSHAMSLAAMLPRALIAWLSGD